MKLSPLMTQNRGRALPGSPSIFSGPAIGKDGSPGPVILATAFIILLIASMIPASASMLLLASCVGILILGLPHGMFDYLILRKLGRGCLKRLVAVTFAYCAVAWFTWLMWQSAPFASLCAFIVIAMVHFAEDWDAEQSRLGAAAMAICMIALPALLYDAELSAIFVLIGGTDAGIISDYLRLIAPVFGLVAVANIIIAFSNKVFDQALRNIILLVAALLLPPGIGFAVYFCLYHSPIHFAEGHKSLVNLQDRPNNFFFYMSVASAAVLLCILLAQPLKTMDAKMIATTFQSLSILTIPHMLLPFFASRQTSLVG